MKANKEMDMNNDNVFFIRKATPDIWYLDVIMEYLCFIWSYYSIIFYLNYDVDVFSDIRTGLMMMLKVVHSKEKFRYNRTLGLKMGRVRGTDFISQPRPIYIFSTPFFAGNIFLIPSPPTRDFSIIPLRPAPLLYVILYFK